MENGDTVFHFRIGPAAGCSQVEVKSRIDEWWNKRLVEAGLVEPPEVIRGAMFPEPWFEAQLWPRRNLASSRAVLAHAPLGKVGCILRMKKLDLAELERAVPAG